MAKSDPTHDALRPVTIVTGGSEGIGFALADQFAAAGDEILLIARGADRLDMAAETLRGRHGGRVSAFALDVTASDALARLDVELTRMGARCHTLVNAAGVGLAGGFVRQEPAAIDRLVALNVGALTAATRHFLPDMLARGDGGVLNVASLGGYAPGPYQAAYYASKAYVISLTEALAHEYARRGVRVSVLCPGPVRTDFHARMGGASGYYLHLLPVASPEAVARAGFRRYRHGQRVIIPGIVNTLMMPALRVLPHRLLSPIIALLLKPRAPS